MSDLSAVNLAEFLAESARRFPERTAVVDPSGAAITYADLDHKASCIAGYLRSRGIVPGDRVGLLMPKSADCIAAIFGILRAGAAYVPVDWTAPATRIRTIFGDCSVRAVFVDARAVGVLAETPPPLTVVLGSETGGVPWLEVIEHPPIAERPSNPEDLAYILYTSGSTGVPKGVMLTHGNAISFVDWCSAVFQPGEEDRFSSHAPFHFDLSVLDIYVAIKHGATLCLVEEELGKNPKDLARFIAEQHISVWYSTPSILALLAEFGNVSRHEYPDLRAVLFAGEVFAVKHLRAIMRLWPRPVYYNLYGPTETNVCTWFRIPAEVPETRTEPYPIGWPCAHCDALILDSEGTVVPAGEEGQLYIAGPSVFRGYWNRPAENEAAFLERNGRRWYNTGDVVRDVGEDGYIYVGRRDRMVKRRGYRIELGEIESGLYRHASVREAAVVAVPATDGVRITAYLATHGPARPSVIEMKAHCAAALPAYMSPDLFVFVDKLPRTSTNKVDYQSLAASQMATAGSAR